jgi:hypothetical protein
MPNVRYRRPNVRYWRRPQETAGPAPRATPTPPPSVGGLPSREEMARWAQEDQQRQGVGPPPSATPGPPARPVPTPTPFPAPQRSEGPRLRLAPGPLGTPAPTVWEPISEGALRLQAILDRLAAIRERLAQPLQPAEPVQPWQPNIAPPFRYPRGVETEYGPYPYQPDYPWGGYEPIYPWSAPDPGAPKPDPYFYQLPRMYGTVSF